MSDLHLRAVARAMEAEPSFTLIVFGLWPCMRAPYPSRNGSPSNLCSCPRRGLPSLPATLWRHRVARRGSGVVSGIPDSLIRGGLASCAVERVNGIVLQAREGIPAENRVFSHAFGKDLSALFPLGWHVGRSFEQASLYLIYRKGHLLLSPACGVEHFEQLYKMHKTHVTTSIIKLKHGFSHDEDIKGIINFKILLLRLSIIRSSSGITNRSYVEYKSNVGMCCYCFGYEHKWFINTVKIGNGEIQNIMKIISWCGLIKLITVGTTTWVTTIVRLRNNNFRNGNWSTVKIETDKILINVSKKAGSKNGCVGNVNYLSQNKNNKMAVHNENMDIVCEEEIIQRKRKHEEEDTQSLRKICAMKEDLKGYKAKELLEVMNQNQGNFGYVNKGVIEKITQTAEAYDQKNKMDKVKRAKQDLVRLGLVEGELVLESEKLFWAAELAPLEAEPSPKPEIAKFYERKGISAYAFSKEEDQRKFVMQKKETRRILEGEISEVTIDTSIVATFNLSQVERVDVDEIKKQIGNQIKCNFQVIRVLYRDEAKTYLITWRDEYWSVIVADLKVNGIEIQPYGLGVGHFIISHGWPENIKIREIIGALSKLFDAEVHVRRKFDKQGRFFHQYLVDFKNVKNNIVIMVINEIAKSNGTCIRKICVNHKNECSLFCGSGSEVRALNLDGKELKEFQIGKTGNNKESYYFACRNRPEGVVCKVFMCNWLDIPP